MPIPFRALPRFAVAALVLFGPGWARASILQFSALSQAIAADPTDAAVAAAIASLTGDNPFAVRQAATNQLLGWVQSNQLTAAQLGTIRAAVGSTNLEQSLRAGQIIAGLEKSVPGVTDLINATMVGTSAELDGGRVKTLQQIDDEFILATAKSTPVFNNLLKLYEAARNSLLAGAANDVQTKFQALREVPLRNYGSGLVG